MKIYYVLHDVHLNIGHGGKHRMNAEVKKKYKNITQELVSIYFKLCESCQSKQKSKSKALVIKPIVFSEMISKCLVDMIIMQSQGVRVYWSIMVYQDHLTKVV